MSSSEIIINSSSYISKDINNIPDNVKNSININNKSSNINNKSNKNTKKINQKKKNEKKKVNINIKNIYIDQERKGLLSSSSSLNNSNSSNKNIINKNPFINNDNDKNKINKNIKNIISNHINENNNINPNNYLSVKHKKTTDNSEKIIHKDDKKYKEIPKDSLNNPSILSSEDYSNNKIEDKNKSIKLSYSRIAKDNLILNIPEEKEKNEKKNNLEHINIESGDVKNINGKKDVAIGNNINEQFNNINLNINERSDIKFQSSGNQYLDSIIADNHKKNQILLALVAQNRTILEKIGIMIEQNGSMLNQNNEILKIVKSLVPKNNVKK